jgi:hypothetical protein
MFAVLRLGIFRTNHPLRFCASALPSLPCGPQRVQITETWQMTTHGQSQTTIYRVWKNMIRRCYRATCEYYESYGGRGITVCDEWKNDPMSFVHWAHSNGYCRGLTIDRIDNNGPYSPSNCRFCDQKAQSNNRRTNRRLVYQGVTYNASELAALSPVSYHAFLYRINSGLMSVEQAVETPQLRRRAADTPVRMKQRAACTN